MRVLRDRYAYSIAEIAGDLDISEAAYAKLEISAAGMKLEHLLKLSARYQEPVNFFLYGDSPRVGNNLIPFIPVKAHAGFIDSCSNLLVEDDYEFFRIPGYDSGNGFKLFEIEGSSMAPTLEPGDIIICQQLLPEKLRSKDPVIVITENEILVKRFVALTADQIVFGNDNPLENKEMIISKDRVQMTCLIQGKITNKLVPSHQMVSSRKLNEMTEALEFLKLELLDVRKKIGKLRP